MIDKIQEHLSRFDLDVRKTHNARFIDQKVTPDVLAFVADCVLSHTSGDQSVWFSRPEIQNSQYFTKLVQQVFSKPGPKEHTAENEYDKFVGQPLKALEYARVLESDPSRREHKFRIANLEILSFIAGNQRNAFNFLSIYLRKVLSDSGFNRNLAEFQARHERGAVTQQDFLELKMAFQQFIIGNTEINGVTEVNRIFPKVINILAVDQCFPGTEAGRMTGHPFYYQDLMYNRINFRDKDKDKGTTRAVAKAGYEEPEPGYAFQRLKNTINDLHVMSEVRDADGHGPADHIHHIFPRSEFPQLGAYPENLIKLTPTQHLSKAHPRGNTGVVDREYQKICLMAKSISIESSLRRHQFVYRKEAFVYVINTGYTWTLPLTISFESLRAEISRR